jgi:hypothetical protein
LDTKTAFTGTPGPSEECKVRQDTPKTACQLVLVPDWRARRAGRAASVADALPYVVSDRAAADGKGSRGLSVFLLKTDTVHCDRDMPKRHRRQVDQPQSLCGRPIVRRVERAYGPRS